MNIPPATEAMTEIQECAQKYARAREVLHDRATQLKKDTEQLTARRMPGILDAAKMVGVLRQQLAKLIENASLYFTEPRTIKFHGVTCGLRKGAGKVDWDDEDEVVVARIRKHLPDKAASLIATVEVPSKEALLKANLSTADLKRIGVTITGTGDQVVIKQAKSDTDKLVKQLLGDQSKGDDES